MDGQIREWLEDLGLGQYADAFAENDVDLRALAYLTDDDLKELGVSLGHRRVLLAAIGSMHQGEAASTHERQEPKRLNEGAVERRQLTVLFCDLVGSTELSIRLDPEDLREVLRRYQNAVTAAVARYEGHVARFLGDGVLAYYGWPRAYEDQAERAIRTGLDAAAAVEAIRFDDGERLRARIGIATGEVVVGDLIGDVSSDVEAVTGETPNLAARLQGVAQPGQIVISATTRRLLGTTFELEDLGQHSLKGFGDAISAWAVVGESAVETRFEAAHEGALTRLVGREHELGLLQERWDLVKDGEGQVVLLSGEAGIGKSRMVEDFRNEIGEELHVNLSYQCSPHHTNSAFYPVIQRLQRAADFSSEDSVETKLDKLEALIRATQDNVAETAPVFAALLSLPAEDRFGELDMTPPQLRYRTIELLIDRVLTMSRQRPVLFVVEDVHWVDPSMVEYVGEIMARVVDQRVFMLITYRTEFDPPWADHPHLTSIVLNRLGRKQAAEIAHSVGGQDLVDAIVDRIAMRADGVPLFVEELTKSVLESYVSKDEATVDDLIPATLQSSLVARIDRLGPAKEIAQIGAVIGREFPYDLLAAVANKTDVEIDAALDRLVQSGLVFRRGVPPDATYTFKHSLVQDAAYTTILIRRRQQLHAQIVETVENQESDEAGTRVDLLAHHAYQGGVWDKAFVYAQEAGQKAMDGAAIREAIAQFKQALDAGARLSDTQESMERMIDLRFDLRNALWSVGAFEEILQHLDDADRLAKKLDDSRRIGWISVYNSASLWQLGRSSEALSAANEAIAINETAGDLPLAVGANFYLGCAYVTAGDCRRAESYFQAVADDLKGNMSRERCGMPFVPAVISRSWLVWALAERGEFEEADAHGEEALRIAEEVGHPFNLAHIYYDLGYFYGVKGDIDRAVETLDRAYALVDEWKLTYLSPFIIGFLGHVTALSGQTADGLALLQRAQAAYEALGSGLFRSLVGVQLGEALLLANKPEEARDAVDQALTLARKRAEQGHEAYGLRLLGDIASHPDLFDAEAAQEHYGKALSLADNFGMRPLAAHCHLGLGRLHSRNGSPQEGEQWIAKATATYRDLGMDFWQEQAQT